MEQLCYNHLEFHTDITEEQEELIVDYLDEKGVEVDLDFSTKTLCELVLSLKPYRPNKVEISEIKSDYVDYGKVNLDLYLKIALEADENTLLAMKDASKAHNIKFSESFFKTRLKKYYPMLLTYKPIGQSYRRYYLNVVYAIAKLNEDYDFVYIPSPQMNITSIYQQVKKIETYSKDQAIRFLANYGLINAAIVGNREMIEKYAIWGATSFREAMKEAKDEETRLYLQSLI